MALPRISVHAEAETRVFKAGWRVRMSDEVAWPSRASEQTSTRGIVASKRSGWGGENVSGEIRPRLTVRAVRPRTPRSRRIRDPRPRGVTAEFSARRPRRARFQSGTVSSSVEACPSTVTRIGNAARVSRGGREAAGVAGGEKRVRAASYEKLKSPEHDPRSANRAVSSAARVSPSTTRASMTFDRVLRARGRPRGPG